MALLGKSEEVEEVASPIRNTLPGESRVGGKGGLVKSEMAFRASEPTDERARQG